MDLSGHEGDIPIPISSNYVSGHVQPHNHAIIHDAPPLHHAANGPPLPLSMATSEDHLLHHHHHSNNSSSPYGSTKKGVAVKYRECLKNHAASIGGNATDGCGEFMPSGEEGTLEALKCSACNCHRNFHRKEAEGESCDCFHPLKGRKAMGQKGLLISGPDAFGYGAHHHAGGGNSLVPRPSPHHMIMPLGALQTSESDEMEGVGGVMARPPMMKKRFRTKFTPEQKEKMLAFAERIGWRIQKQDESAVQQFCAEAGVRRQVLKVWMHNNKNTIKKQEQQQQQLQQQPSEHHELLPQRHHQQQQQQP